ncbi:MAG TPA: glycosyltransferase family 9 protein [Candidatus Binataceae bacterium]|nr:glycosyltransferase family 9 protein [Candidatus Binataceae bacterium]
MTHRNRIVADRLLGVPAAFMFNGLARALGALMRRDHSMTANNVRRVIVAKLLGMGSILQATPLLRALKRRYPNARLTFVTMRSNQELVKRLEWVDEVVTLDDRNVLAMAITTLRAVARLIRLRADLYFDLEVYSAFASLLALWAATRNRIGFYRHSTAFKNGIYTHLVFFNTRMPVRRLYLQLGRVAGLPAGEPDTIGPIRVDEADRAGAQRVLSQLPHWQMGRPYIVINPNASDLLLERRWPGDYVVETIRRLVASDQRVVLIGARDEQPYVQGLVERLPAETRLGVANTAGKLTLGELLALLDGAACVLTNDSGPMHMAFALGRPTVCLFGPADPDHYGQKLPNVETLYMPVFCSPCLYEADQPPCRGENVCMQRIRPELVIHVVTRLTSNGICEARTLAHEHSPDIPVVSETPSGNPLGVVVRASLRSADVSG